VDVRCATGFRQPSGVCPLYIGSRRKSGEGKTVRSGRREPYGSRLPRHRTCRSAYGGSRRVAPERVGSARDPLSAPPYLRDSVPYLGRRPSEEASAQGPPEKRPGAPRQVRPFTGVRPVTMASADSWQFIEPPLGGPSPRANRQVSQGKTRDCPPIYPPHLRRSGPGAIGLQVCLPPRPPGQRLLCGSCASGRGFASGFLPTAPRGAAVAVQLRVPGTKVPRGLAPPSHAPCLAHKQKP